MPPPAQMPYIPNQFNPAVNFMQPPNQFMRPPAPALPPPPPPQPPRANEIKVKLQSAVDKVLSEIQ